MPKLTKENQNLLLAIARKTLTAYLENKTIPEIKIDNKELNQKLGVFVTLKKEGKLRGCLGQFLSDKPLYKLVQEKVIDSAVHDNRFEPVKAQELKKIKIEISLLSPLKRIYDWRKIKLGEDGVFIKKGARGGTFLPQVARETKWGLEEFLMNLCFFKAGLSPDCYQNPDTEIYIYKVKVFSEK